MAITFMLLDNLDGLSYPGRMRKERLQANFRIEPEDQTMIQDLRRSILTDDGKVPSETAIWRMALADLYARKVKGGRK